MSEEKGTTATPSTLHKNLLTYSLTHHLLLINLPPRARYATPA